VCHNEPIRKKFFWKSKKFVLWKQFVDFYERDFTEDSFWPMIFITLSISFLRFSDGFFAPVM
jgi:hypothetical protein